MSEGFGSQLRHVPCNSPHPLIITGGLWDTGKEYIAPLYSDQETKMTLLSLLDELRILAQNGLEYTDNPYDEERYERILELTTEWYGRSVDLPPAEVRARFSEEVGHITPKVSADAAVFDDEGQILLQLRSDDSTWCLPSGYTDPNESPQETALRETREETVPFRVLKSGVNPSGLA